MKFRRSKIPKFIPILSLLILLVLGPIVFSFLQNASGVEAAWVDDNFSYRNAIPITSHTAAESNVYISATIDTSASGQFQSDCGDLRFATVGGDILPYYIVSGCVSASTVVHVFFKSMPAGAQTIYYYYGNPSATNGYASADFATQASSYALGSVASQEKGGAPIAYWKFDEGTGTTTKDSTPNGIVGTLTSGPTWQTSDQCISDHCIYLDGTNDYITTPNAAAFNLVDEVSVSMWVRNQRVTGKNTFLASNASGVGGYGIYLGNTDTLEFFVYWSTGTPAYHFCASNFVLPQNVWTHVEGVFLKNNYLKLYANGNQVASCTPRYTTAIGSPNTAMKLGYQGWWGGGTDVTFKGFIDEFKVYPYARTAAQIKSDFKSRGAAKGISVGLGSKISDLGSLSNGLVGYWKMDESAANSCTGGVNDSCDASGNAGDGAWNGNATTAAGKFGNSTTFDGNADYVSVSDSTAISTTDTNDRITVSAWVYQTGQTNYDRIIESSWANNGSWLLSVNGSYKPTFGIKVGGVQYNSVATNTISTNTWYHITGVYDGKNTTVYVNGEGQTPAACDSCDINNSGANINMSSTDATEGFTGKIDEVRIYNRALSPREVRDLYNWAPGPVAYYNFDEKTGTTANDTSGNSNSGTLGNGTTWAPFGKFGGATQYDGNNDYTYKTSPSGLALSTSNAFTMMGWFYLTARSGYDGVISMTSAGEYTRLMVDSDGDIFYDIFGADQHPTSSSFSQNTWYHYAITVQGGGNAKVYVDGVEKVNSATGVPATLSDITNIYIGTGEGASTHPLQGYIDDVRIYNYARTQKQIVEDMNAGHPVGGSPVGSQVGYWKMDEGQGATINNSGSGGNTYNGTITGATWNNDGKFGKALRFDGTTNSVSVTSVNPPTQVTVSAWFMRKGTPGTGYHIIYTQGTQIEISVPESTGEIRTGVTTATLGRQVFNSGSGLTDGRWHHLALTYDGSYLKSYIDGKQTASNAVTGALSTGSVTTIGYLAGGYATNGLIDEVKIYNAALTSDEIALDYNRGQGMVLGTLSDTSGLTGGSVASSAASALYCLPGDTATCTPPVAEWNFEERSGQTVNDISGNGNTGTITGALWQDGIKGKGLKCNGYTGGLCNVTVNQSTTLDLPNTFTYEAWLYQTSYPSGNPGAAGFHKHGNQWRTFSYSSGIVFQINSGTPWTAIFSNDGSGIIPLNSWTHVTITYNSSANVSQLYINGKLIKSASAPALVALSGSILLDSSQASYYEFAGIQDDTKIFNYVRTPAQVAWDYNQGKPIAQWKMDECQGGSIFDASGNGNAGTITIGATGTQTAVGTCTTSGTAWYNGVTGKFNNSLNFDGTDDYVAASSMRANSGREITLSAWFKPSSLGNYTFAGYGAVNDWINLKASTYLQLWDDINDTNTTVDGVTALSAGNWYHATLTIDTNGVKKLYLNGKLETSSSATSTVASDIGTDTINVGRRNYATTPEQYTGQVDDVRIYNYALTASQVKSIYNGGSAIRFGPATGSP